MYLIFLDGKNGMTQARLSMVVEVAQGIKGFFDAFVGTKLLYKSEQVKKLMIILIDEELNFTKKFPFPPSRMYANNMLYLNRFNFKM